jgi:uncharacterized protein (DUF427 family)
MNDTSICNSKDGIKVAIYNPSHELILTKEFTMNGPGYEQYPEHKVETKRMKERVEVFLLGDKIVETKHALKVEESGYDPVIYIPIEDLHDIELIKTNKDYHCPFKGEADYFTLKHGPSKFENLVWAYNRPYEEVQELRDHIAFKNNRYFELRITG